MDNIHSIYRKEILFKPPGFQIYLDARNIRNILIALTGKEKNNATQWN